MAIQGIMQRHELRVYCSFCKFLVKFENDTRVVFSVHSVVVSIFYFFLHAVICGGVMLRDRQFHH